MGRPTQTVRPRSPRGANATVAGVTTRGPALEGTLDDLALGDLLELLAATRKSGTLEFFGRNPGVIAFHEGDVTAAVSDMGPTLQQVFIGSGLTDAAGWEEALARTEQGIPLTDSVIDAGAEPERVQAVLYEQTVAAVFELLLPSDDRFVFTADEPHEIGHRFRFPVTPLLAEAARRIDAWRVIAEAIPSTALVMRLTRTLPGPQVTITADEWHVLSRVDGRATIADIIRTLGMSAFAVCGVLHRLREAGVVEPVED